MKKLILIFLGVWIVTAGCSNEKEPPGNLIPEDTYIDLLAELQLVKSYKQTMGADSATVDSLEKKIYRKYDITEERFMQSHNHYSQQYEAQKERLDKAIERLRMDLVREGKIPEKSDTTRSSQDGK